MKNGHTLVSLLEEILHFREERDWEQFHETRNLFIALVGEIGELGSLFQWQRTAELPSWLDNPLNKKKSEEELADIFIYLILLSYSMEIDLEQAVISKLKTNAEKYPVSSSRGSKKKYTEL